jgi:hypothetical protein
MSNFSLSNYWTGDFLLDALLFIAKVSVFLIALGLASVLAGLVFLWVSGLLPRPARQRVARLFRTIYFDLFNGAWKLALLASAAVALSIASLWTTFGGLTSFTRNPWLPFLIGLGIQAVMLMSAWLIGESFAEALSGRGAGMSTARRSIEIWLGTALGILLAAVGIWWLLEGIGEAPWEPTDELSRRAMVLGRILVAILAVIGLAYCLRRNEFVRPYVQGLGGMVKSTVLWVMFLASMTASVFFSFDYHFTSIFNDRLRKETADLRTHEQVPNILTGLAPQAKTELEKDRVKLFESDAWNKYEPQLADARGVANRIPEKIEAENNRQLQAQQTKIAVLEQKLETLTAQIRPLAARKDDLEAQLATARDRRPDLQKRVDDHVTEVTQLEAALRQAEDEAFKEEKGVPGDGRTGRFGRKKGWAKAMRTVTIRKAELDAGNRELAARRKQLSDLDGEIGRLQGDLATDGPSLAGLKGDETATRLAIKGEKAAQQNAASIANPRQLGNTLADQIQEFRQAPTAQRLKDVQLTCNALKTAALKVNEGGQIDCDPRQVNELLTGFLDRKTRVDAFIERCTNSQRINSLEPKKMVEEASECLQDAPLDISVLRPLRKDLRELTAMRDDEAQHFTVSLTAFRERNELAYLALIIAVGVDALIFFAGVFGATTMTSPLERAGLRDVARRVRRLPAADVRATLDALRDNRLDRSLLNDPRMSGVVRLGQYRHVPGEPEESQLVMREVDRTGVRYLFHSIYVEELEELMQKARQRGEFDSVAEDAPAAPRKPRSGARPDDEFDRVVEMFVAPRRSAAGA